MSDAAAPARRTYLDVLRGVAVLIMIEAHVIDSVDARRRPRVRRAFGESMILGGFGAPLFLFLAGVAVAMSAGSKARADGRQPRGRHAPCNGAASRSSRLAFVFRFQSFVLSHAPAWSMLKVDILNIMGPVDHRWRRALWGVLPDRARADHRVRGRDRGDRPGDAGHPPRRRARRRSRIRSRATSGRFPG